MYKMTVMLSLSARKISEIESMFRDIEVSERPGESQVS